MASLDPRGLIGRIYVRDHYIFNIQPVGPHGFREAFLSLSHYKSMGTNDTWDMVSLDPKGMVSRIYIGDH